jgi:hypothetical protein
MSKDQKYKQSTAAITRPDFKPTFFDSPLTGLLLLCGTFIIGASVLFIRLS